MNKIDLSWLPSIFENYRKEQFNLLQTKIEMSTYYTGKINASDELLETIKQFIKDSNTLTKE